MFNLSRTTLRGLAGSHMGDQPGGVRDHGSPTNHAFWSTAGFNARHTYTVAGNCNTFNATSAYVA